MDEERLDTLERRHGHFEESILKCQTALESIAVALEETRLKANAMEKLVNQIRWTAQGAALFYLANTIGLDKVIKTVAGL